MVKRLIRDNILLKVIPEEDTVLASGIIMPSVRKDPRIKGEVVAVGPGLPNCPVTTRVGDTAYVERGIGQQWDEGNDTYLIVKENDISAIL